MKYGLCYFKNSENIGDDILSLAGMQYLPNVDYIIDRESLDSFVPNQKETVSVILNGWYLHNTYAFPPSPYINPLFMGIHFDINLITRSFHYLDGYVSDYLKKHSPIGCRDMNTKTQMDLRNIDSYFSGCITLSIEKPSPNSPENDIVVSDLSPKCLEYISTRFNNRNVTEITHYIPDSEKNLEWGEKRINRANNILNIYSGAKLVITSRLHAALPCIAMKTPVILIGKFDQDYNERIGDFSNYVTVISETDLLSGQADIMIKNGPNNIYPDRLIKNIKESCKNFIDTAKNTPINSEILPETEFYTENFVRRTKNMRDEIVYTREALRQALVQHEEDVNTMRKMVALMERQIAPTKQ